MKHTVLATIIAAVCSTSAFAQVAVKDAWVRATVPQQTATGAFMQLTAPADSKLVEAKSPIDGLSLPAGKMVELKPGGYHVMLMDLKGQVKTGDAVPLTLVFEGKDKKRETVEIKASAKSLTGAAAKGEMKHGAHKH